MQTCNINRRSGLFYRRTGTRAASPRADGRKAAQDYEKHRAPARAPRAGVYGGSAPDAASVIIKTVYYQDIMITQHPYRGGGWASAFRRGECARGHSWTRALGVVAAIADTRPTRARAIAREHLRVAPPTMIY